jgi:hypothetical protein
MYGRNTHYLLQCRGCEQVFYYQESTNSEDMDYQHDRPDGGWTSTYNITKTVYPKPESTSKPLWVTAISNVDASLSEILHEVYTAKDQECYMLTAIGIRTAIDRATEILGIEPAKTFVEKLKDLKLGGWIGDTEYDILEVITEAGHAAAHRGWTPDITMVGKLLAAFELFLQRAILVGKDAMLIRHNLPPKPKRIPPPAVS